MTDKEIIKALKDKINGSDYQCFEDDDVLDLINRQQEEIENLTYTLWGVMHSVDKWLDGTELEQDELNRAVTMREKTLRIVEEKQAEIERLQKEVNLVSIQFQDLQERYEEAQTEIERLKGYPYATQVEVSKKLESQIKSEAIKEFAERLKEKSFKTIRNYGLTKDVVEVCDIDNLVKEMVGGKE